MGGGSLHRQDTCENQVDDEDKENAKNQQKKSSSSHKKLTKQGSVMSNYFNSRWLCILFYENISFKTALVADSCHHEGKCVGPDGEYSYAAGLVCTVVLPFLVENMI